MKSSSGKIVVRICSQVGSVFSPKRSAISVAKACEILLVGRRLDHQLVDGRRYDEPKSDQAQRKADEHEKPPDERWKTVEEGQLAHRVGGRAQDIDRDDRREDRQDQALADDEEPDDEEREDCREHEGREAGLLGCHGATPPR